MYIYIYIYIYIHNTLIQQECEKSFRGVPRIALHDIYATTIFVCQVWPFLLINVDESKNAEKQGKQIALMICHLLKIILMFKRTLLKTRFLKLMKAIYFNAA